MSESMRDRLRDELAGWPIGSGYYSTTVSVEDARDMADAILAAFPWLAVEPKVTGATSDGHHSFDELYEYRMLYNAHAAHGWRAAGVPVVKSWRHGDGEECFGGGWFIVTADLLAGQVSNHYEAKHWGLFKVPEVETAPAWDGHTPADAAARLRIEAEHAQPGTVTDEMVEAAARAMFEDLAPGDYTWAQMVAEDPTRADIWREDARIVLSASRGVRPA